jgi:hypothetical protein
LKVKGKDGRVETWTLEGQPTPMLEREGWTRQTLKPGDQIRATIAPLRSGAAGGSWLPQGLSFRKGGRGRPLTRGRNAPQNRHDRPGADAKSAQSRPNG